MKIILASRGMGKTTMAILEGAAQDYYIVCRDRKRVGQIMQMANDMKKHIPFPLTFDEFLNKEYVGKNIKGFIIDDADSLLQYISRAPIYTITMSSE